MKYAWISVIKNKEQVRMILIEGDDIMIIEFCDHNMNDDIRKQKDETPKNKFMNKEEMSRYTELVKVSDL